MLCRWIDKAHDRLDIIPSLSLRSSFIQRNSALFNMEVSIMESLDWRLSSSSKLSPSASGLLFLTGQMHNLPEDCIQALHHLIVSTHMTPEIDACVMPLRSRHPSVLALACLASTLLLSKEAVEKMSIESKTNLLRQVAQKLGIDLLEEADPDFLVCPMLEKQRGPFVRAMEQLARAVSDLQAIAEEKGEEDDNDKS
jgi:hypothetical protein